MIKYLAAILAIILIVPAFLPNQFQVEKSITIQSSQENIYSYLVNLESWQEWSPWMAKEPNAEFSFHGIPGVVGSYTQWSGEVIGAGKQTLTELQGHEYIETKLEFTEPNTPDSIGYMKIVDEVNQVKVIWGMKGELSYPIERVLGLFIPSMIAPDFEKGLKSLKMRLEANK